MFLSIPWRSHIVIGIITNLLVIVIILIKRYYPVILLKIRMQKLKAKEIKFVAYRKTDPHVNRILMLSCMVLTCIPYAFTAFVIMSMGAREDTNE